MVEHPDRRDAVRAMGIAWFSCSITEKLLPTYRGKQRAHTPGADRRTQRMTVGGNDWHSGGGVKSNRP